MITDYPLWGQKHGQETLITGEGSLNPLYMPSTLHTLLLLHHLANQYCYELAGNGSCGCSMGVGIFQQETLHRGPRRLVTTLKASKHIDLPT